MRRRKPPEPVISATLAAQSERERLQEEFDRIYFYASRNVATGEEIERFHKIKRRLAELDYASNVSRQEAIKLELRKMAS